MGKVTVKHYLEKRVNPMDCSEIDSKLKDKLLYPVYVQIISNRKTIQIKSFSEILMTEKGFKYFKDTSKLLDNETSTIFSYKENYIKLSDELNLIEKAVKYNNEVLRSKSPIRETITELIQPFSKIAIQNAWVVYQSNFCEPKYKDYWDFVSSFNFNKNLLDSLDCIHINTGLNLKNKLLKEFNITWECLSILTKLFKELKFIEVVSIDYKALINKELAKKPNAYQNRIITEAQSIIQITIN
jgi:hypothetical protein